MSDISTEASVGKIFILIGFILGFIGSLIMIVMGAALGIFIKQEMMMFVGILYLVLGIIMAVGSLIGVFAFKAASNNDFHKAGILGIVSSVIPPLNIFTLVGGILCIASKESKHNRF